MIKLHESSLYANEDMHSLEAQINTQQYGRRPYGVGLLVAGYDVSLLD